VGNPIVTALRKGAALGTLCLWAVLAIACGGGGESVTASSAEPTSGVLLLNNPITAGGRANTHAVVAFSYAHGGATGTIPLALAPGEDGFVPLAPGRYTLSVTFDDGTTEGLQAPSDQVTLFTGEVTRLRFLHA
jgi:hypothetical protein